MVFWGCWGQKQQDDLEQQVAGSKMAASSNLSGATLAGARAHMGRQLEPARGHPAWQAWEACAMPLHYMRF